VTRLLKADSMVTRDFDPATSSYSIRVAHNMDAAHAATYDVYYQYCDPVTPALKALRCASFTQAFKMRELVRTEFFNDFLRIHRIHWGVNLYSFAGEQCIGDLLVFRSSSRPDFDANDLAALRLLEPALTAAYLRLQRQASMISAGSSGAESECLLAALVSLGKLTKREAEVSVLASQGCADKEIARALGIETTTIRYHLKNALRKLDIKGRNRLAYSLSKLAVGERRH
jgi:DNA-binding CsgD family transcriptional regulator